MHDKVDLAAKLATVSEPFSPKIVGELNDYKLEVVKAKGEFVWHSHPDTDDFFLVLAGRLTIQLPGRDIQLGPGELFVVPRGVEHCPRADGEAHILLIEPMGTPTQAMPAGSSQQSKSEYEPVAALRAAPSAAPPVFGQRSAGRGTTWSHASETSSARSPSPRRRAARARLSRDAIVPSGTPSTSPASR